MGKKADLKISFKQKLVRQFRELPLPPRKLLVAVSGGVDSLGLLYALNEVKGLLRLELTVAHVHHGEDEDPAISEYRKKAQGFVRDVSARLKLPFLTNPIEPRGESSEADLRRFRYHWLEKWQTENDLDAIALGHHFEDLLETQMMRLFRGSSRLGLGAMSLLSSKHRLRLFLNFKKREIVEFMEALEVFWLEDPSNKQTVVFRNQVRQWLGEIEKQRPGSQENLSRSLQRLVRLAQEEKSPWKRRALTDSGIKRALFLSLADVHKSELLAYYIRSHGILDYTSGQIEELRRRLDVSKKEDRFMFLGRWWALNPEFIQITSGV